MPIRCEIVTAERTVYDADVEMVNLPGVSGQMGILPNHSPLLTVLKFGEVYVRDADGEEHYFAVGGGFAEVQPDKVIVLADSAERADEIDAERAMKARAAAEKAMEEGVQEDPEQWKQLEASLRRAQIRIDVNTKRNAGRAAPPQFNNN